jgi:hypothetical protein
MKRTGKALAFPGAQEVREPEKQREAREWVESGPRLKLLTEITCELLREASKANGRLIDLTVGGEVIMQDPCMHEAIEPLVCLSMCVSGLP